MTPIFGPQDYGQQISFVRLLDAVAGQTPVVPIFVFDKLTLSFHNLGLYVQDTWRPTARLTLSYGLRWEFNPPPSAKENQNLYTLLGFTDLTTTAGIAPAGTPLYQARYANFAPRLGVAYQVSEQPGWESVVGGGFRVFYDLGTGTIGESTLSSGKSLSPEYQFPSRMRERRPLFPVSIHPTPASRLWSSIRMCACLVPTNGVLRGSNLSVPGSRFPRPM